MTTSDSPSSTEIDAPSADIQIFDHFVETRRAENAYAALRLLPKIPHGLFCISLEALRHPGRRRNGLCDFFSEELASFLLDYLQRLDAAFAAPRRLRRAGGAIEFWVMRVDPEGPPQSGSTANLVFLHADTRSGPKANGEPHPRPRLSSILHLGDLAGTCGTYVCTEPADAEPFAKHLGRILPIDEALGLSRHWVRIPRRAARVVVFDGTLPHFVEPMRGFPPGHPRITVLANFWDAELPFTGTIESPCRLTKEEFQLFCQFTESETRVLRSALCKIPADRVGELVTLLSKTRVE